MYLTPAQYRARNYAVDVSSWSDAQLAAQLNRSASAIHAYTAAPTLPTPHDFRGGSIVGETHTWRISDYEPVTRRVFLFHRPVKAVSTLRIYATDSQYVEFAADEIYYEAAEGWIEPASANLTSYGLFGAAVIPFVGLSQPHVYASYTYGRRIPIEEQIYPIGGNTWLASIGAWSSDVGDEPVIAVGGVVRPDTDYTIDYRSGQVTFVVNEPASAATVVAQFYTGLHPDIAEAEGLITTGAIADRSYVATLGGLRRLTVAEITIERATDRAGGGAAQPVTISEEAAALLDPFIFRSVAFA
ncbi:MAG TPA: hypothetical protein VFX15_02895 [Actinomycetes bacterium]|nr:hypothetical protein [Actinomycetes bacterium]